MIILFAGMVVLVGVGVVLVLAHYTRLVVFLFVDRHNTC